MMIHRVLCGVMAGIWLSLFMGAGPAVMLTGPPVAGYVEVPPGEEPAKCYELRKGGQELAKPFPTICPCGTAMRFCRSRERASRWCISTTVAKGRKSLRKPS